MSKQEKLDQLLEEYMIQHNDGEIVLTLQWNMGLDDAIKLLEERDGREIITVFEPGQEILDESPTYAYK